MRTRARSASPARRSHALPVAASPARRVRNTMSPPRGTLPGEVETTIVDIVYDIEYSLSQNGPAVDIRKDFPKCTITGLDLAKLFAKSLENIAKSMGVPEMFVKSVGESRATDRKDRKHRRFRGEFHPCHSRLCQMLRAETVRILNARTFTFRRVTYYMRAVNPVVEFRGIKDQRIVY